MKNNLHEIIINALEDVKAQDIVSIDVKELTGVMDTMVVASGNSNRQVKSLANNVVVDAKKAGFDLIGIEGDDVSEWILVDFGDVIVHIMLPATRVFYDLEKLWSLRPDDRPISADSDTTMRDINASDQD
ncbi:ribosome silencing factor [Porticoccaceae bacterium]|nr:ribosome silencing factor [Porticoccaceae bacterium]MDA8878001.1 ribosome silencing factor [Porticoccaceae bacterium]MDA9582829.1 ribosome silencing factor [Porticoccaceae bacterium]MDB2395389.1 ribosome silencing factor [Porticoccaceae bacterium]MDB2559262.1 ribosome silencing factor [Porticoccaceae bacterium]